MGKRYHVSISVAGAIELPDKELISWIGNVYGDDGKPLETVREIRRRLAEAGGGIRPGAQVHPAKRVRQF